MFGKLPGTRYSSQFYLARGLYDQEFLTMVGHEFFNLISDNIGNWNFQLTGRDFSAIPLLVGLPLILKHHYDINIHSFMIKRERKNYGIHNFIEGVPNDLPVLIVDDLCNSTDSFVHCFKVCKAENLSLLPYIFAVVNKYPRNSVGYEYDRYLGKDYKPLFCVDRTDIG